MPVNEKGTHRYLAYSHDRLPPTHPHTLTGPRFPSPLLHPSGIILLGPSSDEILLINIFFYIITKTQVCIKSIFYYWSVNQWPSYNTVLHVHVYIISENVGHLMLTLYIQCMNFMTPKIHCSAIFLYIQCMNFMTPKVVPSSYIYNVSTLCRLTKNSVIFFNTTKTIC